MLNMGCKFVYVSHHVQPVSVVWPHVWVGNLGHVTPLRDHLRALLCFPGPVQGAEDGHCHDAGADGRVGELVLEITDLQEVLNIHARGEF